MKYKVSDSDLTSVADAIRTKGGTSAGLSFPDGFVSAIGNIPTGGGGDPTLITKLISVNGTYNAEDDDADGYSSVTVSVPSGIVTGTFKGTTAGAAITVSLPYTGSGYPIAGVFFPTGGSWETNSGIIPLVHKNASYFMAFAKNNTSTTPSYNADSSENKAEILALYKYSDSDATTTTGNRAHEQRLYWDANATEAFTTCIRLRSATSMSIYIANTSYGFPAGIEFTYMIVYSS